MDFTTQQQQLIADRTALIADTNLRIAYLNGQIDLLTALMTEDDHGSTTNRLHTAGAPDDVSSVYAGASDAAAHASGIAGDAG